MSRRSPRPLRHFATGPLVITIDGPAGSGKSTAAKLLARRLGLAYLDTGATYRTLAYAALRQGVSLVDEERLAAVARRLPMRFVQSRRGTARVLLGSTDVTAAIRTEEVSEAAALVSQHPRVRAALVQRQRALANRSGVVVEGRDTGSVVFPRAPYKFFLHASPAVRARRRQQELARRYGSRSPLAQIEEQLHFRDGLDRTRRVGPLIVPRGAVVVDTSRLSALQVVRVMLRHLPT